MTTYVTFSPSATAPFSFQAILDGNSYTVIITWNVFGQRYYLNLFDVNNNFITAIAMVGSPNDYPINLVNGYFVTSTLAYFPQQNQFVVTP